MSRIMHLLFFVVFASAAIADIVQSAAPDVPIAVENGRPGGVSSSADALGATALLVDACPTRLWSALMRLRIAMTTIIHLGTGPPLTKQEQDVEVDRIHAAIENADDALGACEPK